MEKEYEPGSWGGHALQLGESDFWGPMNKAIVKKENSYSNNHVGITEPQRRIVKALAAGRGHYLIEVERLSGRKVFRCHDKNRNIVSANFSRVVVRNLVSKGFLIQQGKKFYLK